MAYDVKILDLAADGSMIAATWPHPDIVEGEYALVQRIVKNLLTELGEDQFDPDWGSGIASALLGLAGQQQEQAEQASTSALQKCQRDLLSSQPADPAGRLVSLRLRSITYDITSTSWVLEVDVETESRLLTIEAGV